MINCATVAGAALGEGQVIYFHSTPLKSSKVHQGCSSSALGMDLKKFIINIRIVAAERLGWDINQEIISSYRGCIHR